MANTRSAAKQARASVRRHAHNKAILSRLHTLEKKFLALVAEKKVTEAAAALKAVFSAVDKAAKVRVVHANLARRTKSRLTARLKAIPAG